MITNDSLHHYPKTSPFLHSGMKRMMELILGNFMDKDPNTHKRNKYNPIRKWILASSHQHSVCPSLRCLFFLVITSGGTLETVQRLTPTSSFPQSHHQDDI